MSIEDVISNLRSGEDVIRVAKVRHMEQTLARVDLKDNITRYYNGLGDMVDEEDTVPKMKQHEDVKEDPLLRMRVIRVVFKNSANNYQTHINGTREAIGNYFRDKDISVAAYPKEEFETPCAIEFRSKEGEEINMVL